MRRLLLLLLLATPLVAEAPLTNADVLRLLKEGVPASVVAAKIKTSTARFDLTTDAIVSLTKAGVPESVLTAMIEKSAGTASATPAAAAPPTGPDMLVWKQECEKIGWPDYVCRPGESGITFHKVMFYREGARTPGAGGEVNVTHQHISAYSLGRQVFDIPWSDVTSFCAEFAWRNMFYLHTKDGEIKFDLGGNEDELSRFLRRLLLSVRQEQCPK